MRRLLYATSLLTCCLTLQSAIAMAETATVPIPDLLVPNGSQMAINTAEWRVEDFKGAATWSVQKASGENCVRTNFSGSGSAGKDDYLIMEHPVVLQADVDYTAALSAWANATNSDTERLLVMVAKDNTVESFSKETAVINYETITSNANSWFSLTGTFNVEETGNYYFAICADTPRLNKGNYWDVAVRSLVVTYDATQVPAGDDPEVDNENPEGMEGEETTDESPVDAGLPDVVKDGALNTDAWKIENVKNSGNVWQFGFNKDTAQGIEDKPSAQVQYQSSLGKDDWMITNKAILLETGVEYTFTADLWTNGNGTVPSGERDRLMVMISKDGTNHESFDTENPMMTWVTPEGGSSGTGRWFLDVTQTFTVEETAEYYFAIRADTPYNDAYNIAIGNVRLTYLPKQTTEEPGDNTEEPDDNTEEPGDPTSIEELQASASRIEIYTLQGRRIERPGTGLYIILENGKARKVMIK